MSRTIALHGCIVARVVRDDALRLHLRRPGASERFEFVVEGECRLDGARAPATASDLDALLGARVNALAAEADGSARLSFEDGREIVARPGEAYEAWQFTGPDGLLWVGGPDGTVTTWGRSTGAGDELLTRRRLLRDLIELRAPVDATVGALQGHGWDQPAGLVELRGEHVCRILERYLAGEISQAEVEAWADAVEGRDDLDYPPEVGVMLFELANPLVEGALTPERARELMRATDRR